MELDLICHSWQISAMKFEPLIYPLPREYLEK